MIFSFLKKILEPFGKVLLPPLCLICDCITETDQTLCPDCWKKIRFISRPFCAVCGRPFDAPMGDDAQCAVCLDHPPLFTRARACVVYDDTSKEIVLRFKHGDRLHMAPAMARLMIQHSDLILDQDNLVIIPVPLHRWRLLARRYNQSAILARLIGKSLNKTVAVNILTRVRATPSQGHLKREEREKNVKDAFSVSSRHLDQIKGKNIVLIDDVLTTGATANACAKELLRVGASTVSLLTFAHAGVR